jgi:hypothetical protein
VVEEDGDKKKEGQDLKAACWWFKTVLKFTASLRVTWCLFHQGGSSLDLSIQGSQANSQDSLSKMLSTLILCNYSCEHILLRNDLKMLSNLDLVVSGALRRVSFGFMSSPLLNQWVAWWQWCVFLMILL